MARLPDPRCRLGYTSQQVQDILGPRTDAFRLWMQGQTMVACEGQERCGPHGAVVYEDDLRRFLDRKAVID